MKLDHIGIAVDDLEAARKLYGQVLGLAVGPVEELPERKLRISFVDLGAGGAGLELLCPTDPDSAVGKFLASKGPGVQHLAYRVEDIQARLAELKAAGVRLVDEQARPGAHGCLVAFLHPKSTGGVLTELVQHTH
ncbi:MAG TPA: methylmalonyl-CoA epimerase [Myxococcota bacterium]|nr:methylmalonyl-CoA epimerase [Myxococcota bacterium]HRY93531.1 methylmalonyl-CoA epimerase [Myxococcota bacterium]HSA20552.1 methylmalonyl-CoA epimerase [Myxococcota bacterium]